MTDGGQPVEPRSAELQARADEVISDLTAGLAPRDAALALAVLANRTVARLHALSRAEAAGHKDQPTWPLWAQLQNASRTLILQASTCRDLAVRVAGRRE